MHSLCTKIGILPERQCKDTTSPMRKYPHGSTSFRMVPKSFDLFSIYFSFLVGAGFARPNDKANDMGGQTPPLRRASLGEIIGYFKYQTTKLVNHSTRLWQRNYYEHIIRDQRAYDEISCYILDNPRYWRTDKLYCES